jgi:hypothetical protein
MLLFIALLKPLNQRTMPLLKKGGEEIPNNTYGFEIEFCSHDNSVFAFTHVHTAAFCVSIKDPEKKEYWIIETDSGNVLELVTPPLHFKDIATAVTFRENLSNVLVASVIGGCTYKDWVDKKIVPLNDLIKAYYGNRFIGSVFQLETAENISNQIILRNVDDGINIKAAWIRLENNKNDWGNYAGSTILTRSEKDWLDGYSSQMNIPMTVEGYLLYCTKKLVKSWKRFELIVDKPDDLSGKSTSKLERYLNTWFWRNVQFTVFVMYAHRTWGDRIYGYIRWLLPEIPQTLLVVQKLNMTADDYVIDKESFNKVCGLMQYLSTVDVEEPSELELKQLAVLYITVGKLLSGALGSLSESNQLKFQQWAWKYGSTEMMIPNNEMEELMSERRWLEYHSSLKDLTGLWFKGALLDVITKETIFPQLSDKDQFNIGWEEVLGTYVSLMRSSHWDNGRIYTDDLRDLRFKELADRIKCIETQFNQITNFWKSSFTPFTLPAREYRPFLHYGNPHLIGSAWEGRYDTMYPAIAPHDGVGYTYLIEHRFN